MRNGVSVLQNDQWLSGSQARLDTGLDPTAARHEVPHYYAEQLGHAGLGKPLTAECSPA
jgi:hypothetical protein